MSKGSGRKAKIDWKVEGISELTDVLRALGVDLRKMLPDAVFEGALVIEAAARRDAPGPHVYAVMEKRKGDVVAAAVGPDRKHWDYAFAEFGAKPHVIRPKRGSGKRAVAFGAGDSQVVRGEVHHPGVPERPFLRPAIDEHGDEAVRAMGKVLVQAIMKAVR